MGQSRISALGETPAVPEQNRPQAKAPHQAAEKTMMARTSGCISIAAKCRLDIPIVRLLPSTDAANEKRAYFSMVALEKTDPGRCQGPVLRRIAKNPVNLWS